MADDITPLASLSLTHVYYNPADPLSHLCAFLALVPQALCVVYVTLLWSTREAEVLLMLLGQFTCEAINFALKRLIKQERPRHVLVKGGPGYGMPSSHAQFATFWAVALGLFLMIRHRPRHHKVFALTAEKNQKQREQEREVALVDVPKRFREGGIPAVSAHIEAYSHTPWSITQRALVSLGALVVAGLVSWSRIYLGYHTPTQVLAGIAAGTVSAVAWFAVTFAMRETGFLAWALEFPVARWLRIRDLVVEEDLCQAGWEKWEEKRVEEMKKRETKKKNKKS
ncbi:PAP2 superfamily-domain-containing protein [Podospora australis]|uniref:Dolichyldiphosphatase n=1 Tax=Podospora australis TaxID=1536484 RepID=A0AAN6X358_9PEZI|nr:PAP2 superfamily-domain-containing protein [Podospora australis]